MSRIRANGVSGTLETTGGISAAATAFDSAGLAALPVVSSPDIAAIIFRDPATGAIEIVHVTAHTSAATTATILRGREGTTAQDWPEATEWDHGATVTDFTHIESIVAGTNVTVDNTDPANPVISASAGGGGESFDTVVAALPSRVHDWDWSDASGATVADSVGSLNLTLTGTYTRASTGLTGTGEATALGSGGWAESSGLGSIPTGANARTIIVVYKSIDSITKGCLLSYGPPSGGQWFTAFLSDGSATRITLAMFGGDLQVETTAAVDGDWHLAAFGNNGGRRNFIYLDGQMWGYDAGGSINTGTTGNFRVGLSTNNDGTGNGLTLDRHIVCATKVRKPMLDRLYRSLPTS